MFEYKYRRGERALVLASGWAFDDRIFEGIHLPFDVISYTKTGMADFERDLLDFIDRTKIQRVSLMGWSQGALAAGCFAGRHPEFVEQLILVSLRPAYDPLAIEQITSLLGRSKRAYLRQFYKSCFSGLDLETYRRFKRTLEGEYLNMFSEGDLCQALAWLRQTRLGVHDLQSVESLLIFHGVEDRIAPVQDVKKLADGLAQARLVLVEKGGHIPFLSSEFSRYWHGQ